jgi:hypothetical protein
MITELTETRDALRSLVGAVELLFAGRENPKQTRKALERAKELLGLVPPSTPKEIHS